MKTIMNEPDLLEEGFWAILGIIFAVSVIYTLERVHLAIIGFIIILLVSAAVFWPYAQRLK